MAGAPKPPPGRQELPETDFATTREDMLGRFDQASAWLTMADGFQRRGDTQSAAELLQGAVQRTPNNPDLWVGLGNALVIHADGLMTPAAEMAFNRASTIAPDHPGPKFFYGLALAQGGKFDEAEAIWRNLLATAPPDVSWRPMIEQRLAMLTEARMMSGQAPSPSQGDQAN